MKETILHNVGCGLQRIATTPFLRGKMLSNGKYYLETLPVTIPTLTNFFFFLTDIQGLSSVSQLEQLNKRYWYVCQDFTEYRFSHQPNRFPDLMMCLPEVRYIAGKNDIYISHTIKPSNSDKYR